MTYICIFALKGAFQFTSLKYENTKMYGIAGSSVTFKWGFTGSVGSVSWGLKNLADGTITTLVALDSSGSLPVSGVPEHYSKRVNGTLIGTMTSGQAIFTLSNITKSDGGLTYGCKLTKSTFPSSIFDFVQLVVQGE